MSITKGDLLEHNRKIAIWVQSLNELSEEKWRTKIAEDKWTVAEVISHLSAWDEYVIQHRLAISDGNFTASPNVEEFNSNAAQYARMHPKETILIEFANNRSKLIEWIDTCEESKLDQPFYRNYSILEYLGGFIEHDLHHQKQIVSIL